MRDRGQVFTFDMLLALIMAMTILVSSGQALKIANEQTTEYVSWYSLERVTNDSADILVRNTGTPGDWYQDSSSLEIPGFASIGESVESTVPNLINPSRVLKFKEIVDNWDPSDPACQAIMDFFGGTDNFEVSFYNGENKVLSIQIDNKSGAENSLEVASTKRLCWVKDVRTDENSMQIPAGGENAYFKKITIDHTQVETDIDNYVLLLSLSDSDLASEAEDDGSDIFFKDNTDTNLLDHEIEEFDGNTGELAAWIRIPRLSLTEDTEIYMHYGNPSASPGENSERVWVNDYALVQHLNETPSGSGGTHYDSTSNNNDGSTQNGVTTDSSGNIDGADTFDGSNDYIEIPSDTSLNNITGEVTVSAWINLDSSASDYKIFGTQNGSSGGFKLGAYQDKLEFEIRDSGNSPYLNRSVSGGTSLSSNRWYFVSGVYDDSNDWLGTYVDGSLDRGMSTVGVLSSTTGISTIGREPFTSDYYWHGEIDEARVSSVARTSEWIVTRYRNESNPSSFYDVGPENLIISDNTAPSAPGGLTAIVVTPFQINLNWDDNPESDLSHYTVYRSTSSGFTCDDDTFVTDTASSEFSDLGLSGKTTYYYKVKAVDASGNESPPSSETNATTGSSPLSEIIGPVTIQVRLWR
ncbi:hypothetical protein AKJ54_00435 [candidate division MSBL1 archaeon SCGC-AAA382K21]|uniref:Fibronectin type-III domain-containing protein n=1 Tax=candidate division MSBL1 archaeon SCGC-AAA382K21 TaxID=1698283 RepID=A0A133VLG7_9EURY|nr:hypothetical protein AKJ54_00435 [candidate division MSBL1 archaeon SCGC-AAA382K21]